MLNSIKKIENKITLVQEILVSLQDELSVLKTKFATDNNNNNNNNNKKNNKRNKKRNQNKKKSRGALTR